MIWRLLPACVRRRLVADARPPHPNSRPARASLCRPTPFRFNTEQSQFGYAFRVRATVLVRMVHMQMRAKMTLVGAAVGALWAFGTPQAHALETVKVTQAVASFSSYQRPTPRPPHISRKKV